jgi:acetyl esterase
MCCGFNLAPNKETAPMPDDPRWDPAMLAFQRMMEARGAGYPPLPTALPLGAGRATTEALNLPLAEGGPPMAASGESA